ncbi:MAG: PorV/PorQ family protein [bacterium]
MKKNIIIIVLIIMGLVNITAQERKKLAQTGMKFLSLSTDSRASALGSAVTSVESGATAMFYNPATMAYTKNNVEATLGSVGWIADIDYIYGGIIYAPFNAQYGVFGFSFTSVDYGALIGTVVAPNENGYLETGTFKPTAYSAGISYAKALSDKFSVGGSVKYVAQDLGSSVTDIDNEGKYTKENNSLNSVAYDFGILYHTGFKSLNFAMNVRNFSTEIKYKEEGFQLPLTFRIGLSVDAMDFIEEKSTLHQLLVSVDAVHPRDFAEQVNVGCEYTFMKTFSLRVGYSAPNDNFGFTSGFGVKFGDDVVNYGLDYCYTDFDTFSDVHRITFNVAIK